MRQFVKRVLAVALCLSLALTVLACGDAPEIKVDATYTLESASIGNRDVTSSFELYEVALEKDGSVDVRISYMGVLTTRKNGTYTFDGATLRETNRGKTYTYKATGDTLTVTYHDEFDGNIKIVLRKEAEEAVSQEVDFEGVLFGPDMSDSKFFNYCPAIITEVENGQEVMHVWFCTNKDDGLIKDHIGYRKGVRQPSGKWIFSELQIVLEPTEGTWDARHTCDPAVIKGEFSYRGTTYCYLMAYLGCVTEDYSNNETGIAVANAPTGPWVKVDTLNPIVPWADECASGTWGTGMPTLMSIDGKGEVLLTFQSSVRGTGVQRWDLSDLDDPTLEPEFTVSLTHGGIVNSQGQKCNVGIPDFAFDPVKGRFYVFGVTNERNPADVTKTLVNSHSVLAYIDGVSTMEEVCDTLRSGSYTWNVVGYVGPNETGFERNHNPGIVRTAYGYLPDSSAVSVMVTTGHNSWPNENIFTYRLRGYTYEIA